MSENWSSQMHRGLLELSILAVINRQPSYGYEIVTRLAETSLLSVSEGTVYPLLRRMKGLGWLATYWQESESGPPRQYYRLTRKGKQVFGKLRDDWSQLVSEVGFILSDGALPAADGTAGR